MSYTSGIVVFWLRHKAEPTLFSTPKLLLHCANHFKDNVVTLQKSYSLFEYLLFILRVCVQLLIKRVGTLSAFKTPQNLRMPTDIGFYIRSIINFKSMTNQIRQKYSRTRSFRSLGSIFTQPSASKVQQVYNTVVKAMQVLGILENYLLQPHTNSPFGDFFFPFVLNKLFNTKLCDLCNLLAKLSFL